MQDRAYSRGTILERADTDDTKLAQRCSLDVHGYLRNPSAMTWQKKYDWRPSWPGEGHEDWTGFDGEIIIGRIMRDKTTHTKREWYMWSGGAGPKDGFLKRIQPHQGWEKEHWQAAKAVEDWYDAMRERNGMDPR